jgi:glycosyltransferase involved in cell wall biosynthesis
MVSIIIPYFNRPKKIIRCLESVLSQSFQDFEILIIDDYSKLALDLNIDDSRIKVYRNNKNLGPGLSRNVGLDNAKGEYVAFLDSDDYWHTEFLCETTKVLKHKKSLSFVYTDTMMFGNDTIKQRRPVPASTILPNNLCNKRPWATPSCLWDRNKIGNTRYINSRNWEDYVFDSEVALKNNNIQHIPKKLCFCDTVGLDKLSKAKYYYRLQEKSYSIIELYGLLKNTKYFDDVRIRNFFRHEFLTALESYHRFGSSKKFTSLDILKPLSSLESSYFFLLIKWSYKCLPKKLAYYVLNKFKKKFELS